MSIVRVSALGLLLFGATVLSPSVIAAQDEEPIVLDREAITQYARAHMALNDARDDFHGKIGRVHDEEGRSRARRELEEEIDQLLLQHEMTREYYDQVTLMISMDTEARATFEEVMVQLAEEGAPR